MMKPLKPISDYANSKASMDLHSDSINNNQPGDPEKAASVMIQLSKEQVPPLHMFLGKDAIKTAHAKMESFTAEVKQWKSVSESTDF